jgi:1-acyl-sn-glycerol-3-phosphate acyltransferase
MNTRGSRRPTSAAATFDETTAERWERRIVTGPGLLTMALLYAALLPVALAVAILSDVVQKTPWTTVRFTLALGANLAMHVAGLTAVFGAWLFGGRWAGADQERELALEQRIQVWWARTTWDASGRLYRMNLAIEGAECAAEGPLVILSRHTSLLDTLLPLVVLGERHGLRLRYVMKRELLWDPCLDAIGHRWPTAFVRRGTRNARELEHVLHLAEGLGPKDAVVLYPEGTRFSAERRSRVLAELQASHHEAYERAVRLTHVLPLHPGGVLGLLDNNPELEVVFFAHTGLEGASHFRDLAAGKLLDATVKVKLWRLPRSEIPEGHAARLSWLANEWERLDRWVAGELLGPSRPARAPGHR